MYVVIVTSRGRRDGNVPERAVTVAEPIFVTPELDIACRIAGNVSEKEFRFFGDAQEGVRVYRSATDPAQVANGIGCGLIYARIPDHGDHPIGSVKIRDVHVAPTWSETWTETWRDPGEKACKDRYLGQKHYELNLLQRG